MVRLTRVRLSGWVWVVLIPLEKEMLQVIISQFWSHEISFDNLFDFFYCASGKFPLICSCILFFLHTYAKSVYGCFS